jgi:hypothetical protein
MFFFCAIFLKAAEYKADTIIIQSHELNESRTILIFTPLGLQKTDTISILYMLDGEFSKYRFDKITEEQNHKHLIGVGIVNTNRNRDILPGKEPMNFLNFIEKELIPRIEEGYLINERILFGHSFAGGFTIFSMLKKPGLFDTYIASSPTPIMEMIDTSHYGQLDNELMCEIKFYFSYGSNDLKQVKKWGSKLYENLETQKFNRIVWKNEIYNGENHNSSDIISLKKGLTFIK